MKKMFRRLTALTLSMVMCFSFSASAFATELESESKITDVEVISKYTDEDGTIFEIDKIGDNYYYYENNGEQIVSTLKTADGRALKFVKDIENDMLYEYVGIIPVNSTIEDVPFELVKTEALGTKPAETRAVDYSFTVEREMEERYGEPYYARMRYGTGQNNKTCIIYETYTLSNVVTTVEDLSKTMTLVQVVALSGLPLAMIKEIIDSEIRDGIEFVATAISLRLYSARAMYTQIAQIDGQTQAAAGSTIQNYAASVSSKYSGLFEAFTNSDPYFDDFPGLASVAFDVYFN